MKDDWKKELIICWGSQNNARTTENHFPKGLLALPPNNVPLAVEFNVLPNANGGTDDVAVELVVFVAP